MSVRGGACGCCAYWDRVAVRGDEGFQDEGLCRRHPPVAIPSLEVGDNGNDPTGVRGLIAAWPRTFGESDWCGEYHGTFDLAGREQGRDK